MKVTKYLTISFIIVLLTASLCGCTNEWEDALESLQAAGEALQEENAELKKEKASLEADVASLQEQLYLSTSFETVPEMTDSLLLTLGEKVHTEKVAEFTFTELYWTDDVLGTLPDNGIQFFGKETDATYLVVKGTVTNLNNREIDLDYSTYKEAVVDETYTYTAHWMYLMTNGQRYTRTLPAGQTRECYLFVSIPNTVKEKLKKVRITLGYTDMSAYVVGFDKCESIYSVIYEEENH